MSAVEKYYYTFTYKCWHKAGKIPSKQPILESWFKQGKSQTDIKNVAHCIIVYSTWGDTGNTNNL